MIGFVAFWALVIAAMAMFAAGIAVFFTGLAVPNVRGGIVANKAFDITVVAATVVAILVIIAACAGLL